MKAGEASLGEEVNQPEIVDESAAIVEKQILVEKKMKVILNDEFCNDEMFLKNMKKKKEMNSFNTKIERNSFNTKERKKLF